MAKKPYLDELQILKSKLKDMQTRGFRLIENEIAMYKIEADTVKKSHSLSHIYTLINFAENVNIITKEQADRFRHSI